MYWSGNTIFISLLVSASLIGCLPEDSVHFETDLISTTSLLDSVFNESGQDSLLPVQKTITVQGISPETKQLEGYNIKKDLDILKDYDIATARWVDFVDTSKRDSAGMTVITYTTTNNKAPVKEMHIVKNDSQIQSIRIRSQKKSMISEQIVDILWNVNKGYTLKNTSKLLFRKPGFFKLEVNY